MASKIRGKVEALAKEPRRGIKIAGKWYNVPNGDNNLLNRARDLKGKFVEASVEGNALLEIKEYKKLDYTKTIKEINEKKLKFWQVKALYLQHAIELMKYFHQPSETAEDLAKEANKLVDYWLFGFPETEKEQEEKSKDPAWAKDDNSPELEIKTYEVGEDEEGQEN